MKNELVVEEPVEPSEPEEAIPSGEAEQEVVKKVEKQLLKVQEKIEGISKITEVPATRMNAKDPCVLAYELGPRKSVAWFYPTKRSPGYRMILAEMVGGKVGKRTLYITATGVEDKTGNKIKTSDLVKSIRLYIKDRGWS